MKTNLAWLRNLAHSLPDELPEGLNVELTLKVSTPQPKSERALPRWAKIVGVGVAAKLALVMLGGLGVWIVHLVGWL